MAIFKTIEQIKQDIWSNSSDEILDPLKFPKQNLLYDKKRSYSVEDIECWQEIYYQPGNIGLYAAWSPYVECYIIVHNLFLNSSAGIEIY